MNEDELRALVRTAIQRHLSSASASGGAPESVQLKAATTVVSPAVSMSFAQYSLERAPDDTMCIIEPAVRCNHCGFCKCHGH